MAAADTDQDLRVSELNGVLGLQLEIDAERSAVVQPDKVHDRVDTLRRVPDSEGGQVSKFHVGIGAGGVRLLSS
jgi:hypothetical protein